MKPTRAKAGTAKTAAAERRRLFVEAYLSNGCNGTQAAIVAGFAPRSAAVTAARLLKDPNIAALLSERAKATAERAELTTERTLRELARAAYSSPEAAPTWSDKLSALDKAAKIHGLYAKDNEQKPEDKRPVQILVQLIGPK